MDRKNDKIVVENARKAVAIELSTNRALGFSVNGFDAKTKTIYTKTPNGEIVNSTISTRGRFSEYKK